MTPRCLVIAALLAAIPAACKKQPRQATARDAGMPSPRADSLLAYATFVSRAVDAGLHERRLPELSDHHPEDWSALRARLTSSLAEVRAMVGVISIHFAQQEEALGRSA